MWYSCFLLPQSIFFYIFFIYKSTYQRLTSLKPYFSQNTPTTNIGIINRTRYLPHNIYLEQQNPQLAFSVTYRRSHRFRHDWRFGLDKTDRVAQSLGFLWDNARFYFVSFRCLGDTFERRRVYAHFVSFRHTNQDCAKINVTSIMRAHHEKNNNNILPSLHRPFLRFFIHITTADELLSIK